MSDTTRAASDSDFVVERNSESETPLCAPGLKSVETTQTYTHVMRKPRLGVRSPRDMTSDSLGSRSENAWNLRDSFKVTRGGIFLEESGTGLERLYSFLL